MEGANKAQHTIQVPEASIGQMGKLLTGLKLVFNEEYLSLMREEDDELIVQQFLWTDITGLNLRYKPLSLHQLIVEVKTTRIRDTTKKIHVDHFLVLHFHTRDIARIEEEFERRGLKPLVQEGISQVMVYPPFSYTYSVPLRKGINLLGKVAHVFTTLCLLYSVLLWMTSCSDGSQECTTVLGTIIKISQIITNFFFDCLALIILPVYHWLSNFPLIKYPLLVVGALVFLPAWSLLALFAAITYLSELALQFHLFLHLFNVLSLLVTNYKTASGLLQRAVSVISFMWQSGSALYIRIFKKETTMKKKQQ